MAGMGSSFSLSGTGPAGAVHNGMVWNPAVGAYVSPTSVSGTGAANASNNATTAMANAAAGVAGPMSTAALTAAQNAAATSAPGYVSPLNKASIDATTATTALAGKHEDFTEQMAHDKASAISGLIASMQGMFGGSGGAGGAGGGGGVPAGGPLPGMPVMSPGGGDGAPYDMAAESAAYAGAKDRTAGEMQGAMKGLDAAMAARGITGSGIQAEELGKIFTAGQGQLGSADRQMAEGRAQRAYDAEGANADRMEKQREFNLGYSADQQARQQALMVSKINAMLQAAGLY